MVYTSLPAELNFYIAREPRSEVKLFKYVKLYSKIEKYLLIYTRFSYIT